MRLPYATYTASDASGGLSSRSGWTVGTVAMGLGGGRIAAVTGERRDLVLHPRVKRRPCAVMRDRDRARDMTRLLRSYALAPRAAVHSRGD
jgi:hypothetical protein